MSDTEKVIQDEQKQVETPEQKPEAKPDEVKKVELTQEELDALLQKEGDRRVTRFQKEEEAKISAAEAKAKAEAEGKLKELVDSQQGLITTKDTEIASLNETLQGFYEVAIKDVPDNVKAIIEKAGGDSVKSKLDFLNSQEIQALIPKATTDLGGDEMGQAASGSPKKQGKDEPMFPSLAKKAEELKKK